MKIITHEVGGVWVRFPGTAQLNPSVISRLVEDGVWGSDDLSKYNLKAADPFVVPEGKVIVGEERFENDGTEQVFDVDDAPVVVPDWISPLQARKALRAAGLYDAVVAFVDTLPDEEQEEWEYATEIWRNNPIISQGATALGLTEAQIDSLFIEGAKFTP